MSRIQRGLISVIADFFFFVLNFFPGFITGKEVCHGAEHQERVGQAEPRPAAAN